MKIRFLLFIALFCSLFAQAQDEARYSYITDRKFVSPEILQGYTFNPNTRETIDGFKQKLTPGTYSFAYSGNYLYVEGKSIKGVYSVNNVAPTEYGYKMNLMNARDPSIQGHLKIILNDKAQAEALVLKRSRKEQEMIFHLPIMGSRMSAKEEAFFTDISEMEIESIDSIWNNTVYPFINAYNGDQRRLIAKDSTYIIFKEDYKIIDKRKAPKAPEEKADKPKKEKKKKKKKKREEEEEEDEMDEDVDLEEEDDLAAEEEADLNMDEDGQSTVEADTLVDLSRLSKRELEAFAAANKKVKLKKKFFIYVKRQQRQKDGSYKLITEKYTVEKVQEREDTAARDGEERFQLDFSVNGRKHIYVYLLSDRTISSIELGYNKYYVRGH